MLRASPAGALAAALETNDSAVQFLGDETLREIARELVARIDWTICEDDRANLRRLVKRILRKHGYPPHKREKATRTVLEQAEALSAGRRVGCWAEYTTLGGAGDRPVATLPLFPSPSPPPSFVGALTSRDTKCSTSQRSATSTSTHPPTIRSASLPARSAGRSRLVCCRAATPAKKGLANTAPLLGDPGNRSGGSPGIRSFAPRSRTPLPLPWFDHPRARLRAAPSPEEARVFFAHLSGGHLAGYPNRPSGAELARLFRAPRLTPVERDQGVARLRLHRTLGSARASLVRRDVGLRSRPCHSPLQKPPGRKVIAWINLFGVRPGERA